MGTASSEPGLLKDNVQPTLAVHSIKEVDSR